MTQYAQPTVKVEELRLPGLDGMLPGGKVKGRNKVALEGSLLGKKMYSHIYKDTEGLLNDVSFSEADLKSFIYTKCDVELPFHWHKIVLGMYTGCLLELLTKRNRQDGKRTRFYINGNGSTFGYLFYRARDVDMLVVENFYGLGLCNDIGANSGHADIVIVNNIKSVCGCSGFGSDNGSIDMLYMTNIIGNLGSNVAEKKGNVGIAVLRNKKHGTGGLDYAAQDGGNAGVLIADNVEKSNFVAHRVAYDGGHASKLLVRNIKGHSIGHEANPDELICGDYQPVSFQKVMDEFKVDDVTELIVSLKGKTPKEISKILRKIDSIYYSLKPKLDKLMKK